LSLDCEIPPPPPLLVGNGMRPLVGEYGDRLVHM
jgi:hypothetical protein